MGNRIAACCYDADLYDDLATLSKCHRLRRRRRHDHSSDDDGSTGTQPMHSFDDDDNSYTFDDGNHTATGHSTRSGRQQQQHRINDYANHRRAASAAAPLVSILRQASAGLSPTQQQERLRSLTSLMAEEALPEPYHRNSIMPVVQGYYPRSFSLSSVASNDHSSFVSGNNRESRYERNIARRVSFAGEREDAVESSRNNDDDDDDNDVWDPVEMARARVAE